MQSCARQCIEGTGTTTIGPRETGPPQLLGWGSNNVLV